MTRIINFIWGFFFFKSLRALTDHDISVVFHGNPRCQYRLFKNLHCVGSVLKSLKELLLNFTFWFPCVYTYDFSVHSKFKSNRSLDYLSVNRMRSHHTLIHDINKPVLNSYFQSQFVIRKLDKSLYTSLTIKIKIVIHKNVNRYILDICSTDFAM